MYNDWAWNSQSPTRSVCAMLEGHSAPVDWCMCGLHGHHRLEFALADYLSNRNDSVVGAVLGWGRLYLHNDGWRAEWAQPLALTVVGPTTQSIQGTAQLLGIPLVRQDAIEDYAVDTRNRFRCSESPLNNMMLRCGVEWPQGPTSPLLIRSYAIEVVES